MPCVSVVIAAYNCGGWIADTIDDVLSQSYPDLELIVVDDGSSDNTGQMVTRVADGRIRYIKQANSGSPAKPRNTGLREARGRYITFLDHDDRWRANRLELVMRQFETNPAVDIVCHDENVVKNGSVVSINRYGRKSQSNIYLSMLLYGNMLSPSATTIKTDLVKKAGGFDESREFFTVEDFDLWLKLARMECSFVFLQEVLGDYVFNGSNMISNYERHHENRLNLIRRHLEAAPDVLAGHEDRILAGWNYSYARDLHRDGRLVESRDRYFQAVRGGYWSFKAFLGLVASALKVKV